MQGFGNGTSNVHPSRPEIRFWEIEFEVLHYIQYDFVRQRPGLSMIRLACSNVLLFIQCLWQSDNTYFSSSDWSTLKFLFIDVTNVL